MTGVFQSAIFGIPILKNLYRNLKEQNIKKSMKTVVTGILVLIFFLAYSGKYLFDGYIQFCTKNDNKPEFCHWMIPNIYSYI